jgi:hypothetical protein
MDFYNKYLKYKEKYLNLKKLLGGGEASARDMFLAGIARNYDGIISILLADRDRGFLRFDGTPAKEQTDLFKNIFEQIYNKTNKDKKNIDWIIKSYINNTFGRPSSLENLGRYQDTIKKYNSLKENSDSIKPINEIYGLLDLEDFIDSPLNQAKMIEINEKKAKQKAKSDKEKKVKELGEDDKIIQLETDKVFVYTPTTENGARYYGRNTRWCTAAEGQNMFDYYNGKGQLYIIQSKTDPKLKFQIHIQENQIMNDKDDPVTEDEIKRSFNDEKLNKFLDEAIIDLYLIEQTKKNEITINDFIFNKILNKLAYFSDKFNFNILYLDLENSFDEIKVGELLKNFNNLKILNFGRSFNKPLGKSLNNLINLEELYLNERFNKLLDNSLDNLINLKTLYLGGYNRPLGNSLANLNKLENLEFGREFKYSLGNSLDTLINLKTLILGYNFNLPLNNSLDKLINLRTLKLSNFYQSLNNSLANLNKLESLEFYYQFNQPLGNSLDNLINLNFLQLGYIYNQPLGNSLDNLINLKTLKLSENYNYKQDTEILKKKLPNLNIISF